MTDHYAKARAKLFADCREKRITQRQYSARLFALNRAEGRALQKAAREAQDRLNAYTDRMERERSREQLARDLSRSLRKWPEVSHA